MSFCCIVNYRIADGSITKDMEDKPGRYFRRCCPQSSNETWEGIIILLKDSEVQKYYGIIHPSSFWAEVFPWYTQSLYIQDDKERHMLIDKFCDYSTLPSSSAYVERCFSVEKSITKVREF